MHTMEGEWEREALIANACVCCGSANLGRQRILSTAETLEPLFMAQILQRIAVGAHTCEQCILVYTPRSMYYQAGRMKNSLSRLPVVFAKYGMNGMPRPASVLWTSRLVSNS